MKKTWPRITETINHGVKMFVVDARVKGKGERRFYTTRGEAKVFAQQQRAKRISEGSGAIQNAELAGFGWSVHRAIEHALTFLRAQKKTQPLTDAVKAFLKAKEEQGVSRLRVDELRQRLRRFEAAHPGANVGAILTKEISAFLKALPGHATTKMNFRRDLHGFFEWCATEELIDVDRINPVARADTFTAPEEEITTINPKQFARLLAEADDIIRPVFILGGFCAMRQAEIARLDWRDIDLTQKLITVSARVAKNKTGRRTVRIPEPAIAWLRPLAKETGPVLPPQPPRRARRGKVTQTPEARLFQESREAWDMARLRAGFGPFGTSLARIRNFQAAMTEQERKALVPWPENALRHSAISARYALRHEPEAAAKAFGVDPEKVAPFVTLGAVADDAGNSPDVLKKHYNALTKPESAKLWFSILPETPDNVIPAPMPQASAGTRRQPARPKARKARA